MLLLSPFSSLGCGDTRPIADAELAIDVAADLADVEFGKAFPLTVVRTWDKSLTPEPWDDKALAPLTLRPLDTARREDARRVEETRRFAAYAFATGDVVVPPAALAASPRGGGERREVRGAKLALRVRSSLDPKAPGPVELPELLPPPTRWSLWAAVGAATLLVGTGLVARRRRRPAPTPAPETPSAPSPSPHETALARLARLDASLPDEAFHAETAAIVRDYVGARFGVKVRERTSEEIAAATPAPRLRSVLGACDLVKFARQPSSADERARLVEDAARLVRETAA